MGVVHKLKKEVVDFIVLNKKESPSLSCRDISLLATDKFDVSVSKSSVNNILKKAELSSSVGRRLKDQIKNKKFYIPLEKKKQLKDSVQKIGKILDTGIGSGEKDPVSLEPRHIPEVIQEIRLDPVRRPKMEVKEIDDDGLSLPEEQGLKLRPDPIDPSSFMQKPEEEESLENISLEAEEEVFINVKNEETSLKRQFLNQVDKIRQQKGAESEEFQPGAGLFLLEAVQWALSKNSLLASLMRKHTRGAIPVEFDDICKILLIAALLGPSLTEKMLSDPQHMLWQVYGGLDKSAYLSSLYGWMNKTSVPRSLFFEYAIEKSQAFHLVGAISLISNNGQRFYFDPQGISCSSDIRGVYKNYVWPLHLCFNIWSNSLFKDSHPMIFLNAAEHIDRDIIKELIMALSGLKDRHFVQVCLYDKDEKEMACFDRVIKKKKSFILAFWPWQDIFQDIKKTVKWVGRKCYYHRTYDQALYYAQTYSGFTNTVFDLAEGELETITIWRPEEEDPFLILVTNEENKSTESILEDFVSRWPYLEKSKAVLPYFNREKTLEKEDEKVDFYEDLFLNEDFSFIKTEQNQENIFPYENIMVLDLFHDYAQSLLRYLVVKALPPKLNNEVIISDLFARICRLKGRLHYYPTFVKVEILLDNEYPLAPLIDQIIQIINEEFIHDAHNRRFFIEKTTILS